MYANTEVLAEAGREALFNQRRGMSFFQQAMTKPFLPVNLHVSLSKQVRTINQSVFTANGTLQAMAWLKTMKV